MATQRKLKRIQLIAALEIYSRPDSRLLGVLLDITVEGLGGCLREKLEATRNYDLRLALPSEIMGCQTLDVTGRCAWVLPASNPDLFNTGFQFVDITPDAVEVIEELIRRYQR